MRSDPRPPMIRELLCWHCGAVFMTAGNIHLCGNCSPLFPREPTGRENSIIRLVSRGWRNKQIAHELKLSEGTVKVYISRIFDKLHVSNRTELALWELQRRHSA